MKIELLKSDKMKIPVVYEETRGFVNGTDKILEDYITLLEDNKVSSDIISKVCKFRDKYKLCIQNYLKGKHGLAYKKFDNAINELGLDFGEFITKMEADTFYRARINTTAQQYDTKEMFHIGLDKRVLVKTERYSFPGLPCLYLGASSYACWVEMDCPRMEDFQVALLKKNREKNIQVIDLSLLPEKEYEAIQSGVEEISFEKYLVLWPLIAMCSVKVNNTEAPFKPEYIFPQFVLEYALGDRKDKDKQADGIKYASIKVSTLSEMHYKDNKSIYACYVFPVKSGSDTSPSEDDNLSDIFKIESTYSGRILQILTDAVRELDFVDNKDVDATSSWIYADKKRINYKNTIFYRIEKILNGKLERNGRKLLDEPPEEWFAKTDAINELFVDKRKN